MKYYRKGGKHVFEFGVKSIKTIELTNKQLNELKDCIVSSFNTTLEIYYDDNWNIDMKITSCCKTGPIVYEKYCPQCGRLIIK